MKIQGTVIVNGKELNNQITNEGVTSLIASLSNIRTCAITHIVLFDKALPNTLIHEWDFNTMKNLLAKGCVISVDDMNGQTPLFTMATNLVSTPDSAYTELQINATLPAANGNYHNDDTPSTDGFTDKTAMAIILNGDTGQGVMKSGDVNTDKYTPLGKEAILAIIAPSGGIRKIYASDLSINWTITITNV